MDRRIGPRGVYFLQPVDQLPVRVVQPGQDDLVEVYHDHVVEPVHVAVHAVVGDRRAVQEVLLGAALNVVRLAQFHERARRVMTEDVRRLRVDVERVHGDGRHAQQPVQLHPLDDAVSVHVTGRHQSTHREVFLGSGFLWDFHGHAAGD